MQDLTLVGVHDDGEHLVLAGPDGHRYRVRVDEPLRAAVRRDRARLGQLQNEQSGTLRPRDIQARIRAGHTAEEVAAHAGVPLENVRRYEGPVLAEREFVARQARAVRVRRGGAGTAGSDPTLDELVTQRLTAREVDPDAVAWDAWRTDGTWFIRLTFSAGGRERNADWTYDVQLRHVSPVDDEARWLLDELPPEAAVPGRRALAPVRDGAVGRADAPGVRERVYDVEATAASAPPTRSRPARLPRRSTCSTPCASAVGAGSCCPTRTTSTSRPTRSRWPSTSCACGRRPSASRRPRTRRARARPSSRTPRCSHCPRRRRHHRITPGIPLGSHPAPHPAPPAVKPSAPRPSPPASGSTRTSVPQTAPVARPAVADASAPARPASLQHPVPDPLDLDAAADRDRDRGPVRRGRRASVPSWDDIVFGSRRD